MKIKRKGKLEVGNGVPGGKCRMLRSDPYSLFIILTVVMLLAGTATAFANNVALENISLEDRDTTNDTYDIKFDISWENSWFITGAPSLTANWDAAWVFAKYSVYSAGTWSDWGHATLLNTGYTAPTGSQMSFGDTGGVYKGVFIYRSAAGTGTVDWDNAELRWNYGADGVADGDTVKVKLFVIEMVYVPAGSFYVGDTDNTTINSFFTADGTYLKDEALPAYQITSEAAITVGTANGNLYYDDDNSEGGDQLGPIPAAFPKGYNAFYIMKYEISQRQYAEFLNTLTSIQQDNRWVTGSFDYYRYFIKKASNGKFGSDANNNAGADGAADWTLMNESNDGEWVAGRLSYMDGAAYADWAALRPFTELEFTKAARGGQPAVNDEYVWGNTTLETAPTSLVNAATVSEVSNQGNLNYKAPSPDGPFRVGSFADATSTRTNAGAGYYGALELSGNLWERPITVGDSAGRAFTGTHGDGVLTTTSSYEGNATNTDWPGINTTPSRGVTSPSGSGFRGGRWYSLSSDCRVSDRLHAARTINTRGPGYGGRAARTAP